MKLLKRMKKQVALISALAMALGMQVTTMASDYSGHWAADVISEWHTYGVIGGYQDGTFKPNNNMTRAEFAVVLSNVFGLVDTDRSISFADVNTGAWYTDAVNKVAAAGVMQGAAGKFNPSATITRQEAAVALVNAYNLTEKGSQAVNFTDSNSIASWANEQVEIMASKGYVTGRVNGAFDPKANITRAEVLKMLDNMTAALFNKAGTYTKDAKGNVIVNTQDVILKDMTITGDLYLAQGINLGDATLENVTVEGTIFVAGGGVNSIHFNNVTAKKGIQVKTQKAVRLVSENSSISAAIEAGQEVILTGNFNEVTAQAGSTLELKSAKVEKIIVEASTIDKIEVKIDSSSAVKEIVANAPAKITGAGKIDKLIANVEGITSTIRPTEVTGKPVDMPSTGGGAGGGGGGSSSGGNGGTTQTKQEYIQVSEILVGGINVLDNGITINNGNITIDMSTLEVAFGSEEISGATATVTNLAAGSEIDVTVKLGTKGFVQSYKLNSSKQAEYTVKAFTELLSDTKPFFMNKLEANGLMPHVEKVESELGVSIDDLFKVRDSISAANVLSLYSQLLDLYQDTSDDELKASISKLISYLDQLGVKIQDNQLTYKVTISGDNLNSNTYNITINF